MIIDSDGRIKTDDETRREFEEDTTVVVFEGLHNYEGCKQDIESVIEALRNRANLHGADIHILRV